MTSEACYVYLHMPGSLEVVTCGRLQIDHLDDGTSLGRFVYGRNYLSREDAVPLDPFHLPLLPTEFRTVRLGGLFGALRDVAPDSWGRSVIQRRTGARAPTEFEYLTHPARGRIGALELGEPVEPGPGEGAATPDVVDLRALRDAAARIEADLPVDEDLEDLLQAGSSMGGARPKTVVRAGAGLWLAKFSQRGDRWSNAAVEGGMLRLAAACGIRVPEVRVEEAGEELVLLVRRFDREGVEGGELRHRMVSALTVLDLDDTVTDRSGWSYLDLADELQRWSEEPLADKRELLRRIAFNALISNTDDHPRNHALLAGSHGSGWRLSPAYDLTPTRSHSLERRDLAMIAGAEGRAASRRNILSEARRFGFTPEEAARVVDEVRETIESGWREAILEMGGTRADSEAVRNAIAYPGFGQGGPGV